MNSSQTESDRAYQQRLEEARRETAELWQLAKGKRGWRAALVRVLLRMSDWTLR